MLGSSDVIETLDHGLLNIYLIIRAFTQEEE